MKLMFSKLLGVVMLLLLSSPLLYAQVPDGDTLVVDKRKHAEVESQAVLERLLKYAAERKYDSFAKLMAYTGRDPNRNMRAVINPMDPHEKLEMENTCNYLHHWLTKSALQNPQNFRVVKGSAGDLVFWDSEFTLLNGKTKKFVFSFVELQGKYFFCTVEKA